MPKKNQHVVPHADGWAVKGAGNERVTSVHETQREAIAAGREIAINYRSELLTHNRQGRDPRAEVATETTRFRRMADCHFHQADAIEAAAQSSGLVAGEAAPANS